MKGMKGEEMVKTNYGIEPRMKMHGKPNRLKKSECSDRLKKPRTNGYVQIE